MGGGIYMMMPISFFFLLLFRNKTQGKNEAQDALILESDVYQGHGA